VRADGVEVRPIDAEPAARRELQAMLVLAYTGQSHFSAQTHERVWTAYGEGNPAVTDALRTMRDLAAEAGNAMRAADWVRLGDVMSANWVEQQRLDVTISTPAVRTVETAMRDAGVLGLKATGAGAGGCLVALTLKGPAVRRAAGAAGATVFDVGFDLDGVRVARDEDADG
jgi:galactokinase/mevalonate kinase-like predicted kinase